MNETTSNGEIHVRLEFISWASTFVGGDGNERKIFDEEVPEGATLREVLKFMSGWSSSPGLQRLWVVTGTSARFSTRKFPKALRFAKS
jgi:hypothetical protein